MLSHKLVIMLEAMRVAKLEFDLDTGQQSLDMVFNKQLVVPRQVQQQIALLAAPCPVVGRFVTPDSFAASSAPLYLLGICTNVCLPNLTAAFNSSCCHQSLPGNMF